MVMAAPTLRQDYWETFQLQPGDIEYLYNHLLETEIPLTSQELIEVLVKERIRQERLSLEQQRTSRGAIYMPKERYEVGQTLVFPALGWRRGEVRTVRPGNNPDLGEFEVIQVAFEDGAVNEFAAGLQEHALNQPVRISEDEVHLNPEYVLRHYREDLVERLEET